MTEPRDSKRPKWVDFHCHLDLYPDHEALIAESDQECIATLTVTTTPKAWPRNRELAARSTHVRVALGLHPQVIAERAEEVFLLEKYLPEARYVGEVGLDAGPRFYKSLEQQERTFERVLRACAEHGAKILTVHSVRAVPKVLGYLEAHMPQGRCQVILHWFTGTAADARRAAELGCYFSINAQMLRSPKHRELVAKLPGDRLLTETDGPFVQVEGRAIRPRDVAATVTELATIRSVPERTMQKIILENLNRLVTT
jgi:TatD DNase family protein